jgi:hypothetical protein
MVYLVWAYDNYYPSGPNDLKGVYSNLEDAEKAAEKLKHPEGQWMIYDNVAVTSKAIQ